MSERRIVHTPSVFEVDESFQDERWMKIRCAAMHSGINRNLSSFSVDCIKEAEDTFKNIPILAHVIEYTDKDGNKHLDYGSHDFHIEDDKFNEGEQRIIYDEAVVGIIPETNDFELVENEDGNYNVMVNALLYREYGNYVCDILEERGGKTDVSMEILCENISYDAKEKCLVVGKMIASGLTLLGDDVTPGMKGAHAEMFSMTDDTRHDQLIRIMQELKESLDNYTATIAEQNSEKGGKTVKKQFDEAENPEVIDEEVTAEEKAEETVETPSEEEVTEETPAEDEKAEEGEKEAPEADEETPAEEDVEEPAEEEKPVAENISDLLKMSVTVGESTREFSLSMDEKYTAICELVNDTFGGSDNDYFGVDIYDDDNYVIMIGWWSGKAYKQSFSREGDTFSLVGERVEVFAEWLTAEEQSKLSEMRSNYDSIAEKLAKYEAEPEKIAILNSEDYANLEGDEAFEALKEQANHFDLSVDEIKAQLDSMLLEYAKGHKVEFSQRPAQVGMKRIVPMMPNNPNGKGKYGGVFNRKK